MADDIQKVITANAVKNGTAVLRVDDLGNKIVDDTYVKNYVVASDKYDNRFDDYHYYS